MRRFAILAILALAIGLIAWLALRDGGWLQQSTEARVEEALLENGVPPEMAACMAPRLTDDLSPAQLRSLEALGPREGEARLPRSTREALERLRRVEDDAAVAALARAGTRCGVSNLLDRFGV